MPVPKMMTQKEVAEVLRTPQRTIRFFTAQGKLRGTKCGRHWTYREQDVVAFIEASTTPDPDAKRGPRRRHAA